MMANEAWLAMENGTSSQNTSFGATISSSCVPQQLIPDLSNIVR